MKVVNYWAVNKRTVDGEHLSGTTCCLEVHTHTHPQFLCTFKKGKVLHTKTHCSKIFRLLDRQSLIHPLLSRSLTIPSRRKTNLTTRDKLPKGQKTFQPHHPVYFLAAQVFSNRTCPLYAFHFLLHLTLRKDSNVKHQCFRHRWQEKGTQEDQRSNELI